MEVAAEHAERERHLSARAPRIEQRYARQIHDQGERERIPAAADDHHVTADRKRDADRHAGDDPDDISLQPRDTPGGETGYAQRHIERQAPRQRSCALGIIRELHQPRRTDEAQKEPDSERSPTDDDPPSLRTERFEHVGFERAHEPELRFTVQRTRRRSQASAAVVRPIIDFPRRRAALSRRRDEGVLPLAGCLLPR